VLFSCPLGRTQKKNSIFLLFFFFLLTTKQLLFQSAKTLSQYKREKNALSSSIAAKERFFFEYKLFFLFQIFFLSIFFILCTGE
jgi:hypothetical protein